MERVELNLDHLGREPIFEGDLQRAGAIRFAWLDTHALLFDHYFILAKTVAQLDGARKKEIYDGSKLVRFLVWRGTDTQLTCSNRFLCNCLFSKARMMIQS